MPQPLKSGSGALYLIAADGDIQLPELGNLVAADYDADATGFYLAPDGIVHAFGWLSNGPNPYESDTFQLGDLPAELQPYKGGTVKRSVYQKTIGGDREDFELTASTILTLSRPGGAHLGADWHVCLDGTSWVAAERA